MRTGVTFDVSWLYAHSGRAALGPPGSGVRHLQTHFFIQHVFIECLLDGLMLRTVVVTKPKKVPTLIEHSGKIEKQMRKLIYKVIL